MENTLGHWMDEDFLCLAIKPDGKRKLLTGSDKAEDLTAKNTINIVERQSTEWEKIFASYVTEK